MIQVEQELMIQALNVLLGLDNRLEVLILNWDESPPQRAFGEHDSSPVCHRELGSTP